MKLAFPGSCLVISSLPGKALRALVDIARLAVIIASLKSETMSKLINRIPGSCLVISSLPGSALRTHVE